MSITEQIARDFRFVNSSCFSAVVYFTLSAAGVGGGVGSYLTGP